MGHGGLSGWGSSVGMLTLKLRKFVSAPLDNPKNKLATSMNMDQISQIRCQSQILSSFIIKQKITILEVFWWPHDLPDMNDMGKQRVVLLGEAVS